MAKIRENGILSFPTPTSLEDKEGYLAAIGATGATVATSAAAARGVILDADGDALTASVAILGAYAGTAHLKANGAITRGSLLAAQTDGTVKASATGTIVGVALEDAASGELFEAALRTPAVVS